LIFDIVTKFNIFHRIQFKKKKKDLLIYSNLKAVKSIKKKKKKFINLFKLESRQIEKKKKKRTWRLLNFKE